MPPDLEPFLLLILPQIISPVTTCRKKKKSRVKSLWKGGVLKNIDRKCFLVEMVFWFGAPLILLDTSLLQANSITTEVNCTARCLMLR